MKPEIVEENAVIERPADEVQAVNPYDRMIELAISSDLGIEKLEKFLELKEKHEKNEARKNRFIEYIGIVITLFCSGYIKILISR